MNDRKRVVVSGAGWITPLGHDLESVWKRLQNGETAVAPIDRFQAASFPTTSMPASMSTLKPNCSK